MASTLSITLRIGGRSYPMKVTPEEEQLLRKSAKLLEKKIYSYKDKFQITDIQDALSMIAFDLLVEKAKAEHQYLHLQKEVISSTEGLHKLLSAVLSNESTASKGPSAHVQEDS